MLIDSAQLIVGMGPLAIYLLFIAVINLLSKPFLVSGGRDLVALATGVSGLVMIGPVQLFTPPELLVRLGPYYWLLLLLLYASSVSLWILFLRPRLVIYNIGGEEIRQLVSRIALQMDPASRWAGHTLEMPQAGLLIKLASTAAFRNATLSAESDYINIASWRRLTAELAAALHQARVARNPRGITLGIVGLVILVTLIIRCTRDLNEVTEGFVRFFGL